MDDANETAVNHRFASQLKKGRDAGNVQFVLHGESLSKDWYNNGFLLGTHGFRKSLIKQLLLPAGLGWVEKVVVLSNRDIALYEPGDDDQLKKKVVSNYHQLSACIRGEKEQEFRGSSLSANSSSAAGANDPPPENTPQQDEGNQSGLALYNCFTGITELLEDKDIAPIAVIVENLAWISELFPNRNHKLEYLEEIEKWGSISAQSRHLSFISLPSLDEFSTYLSHITADAENCIFITGPNVEELRDTLEEFYTKLGKTLSLPKICDWDGIATALKLKGYSLLQSIHFLDSFCRDLNQDETPLKADDFTSAFKKRLGITIEEVDWQQDVLLPSETKSAINAIFEKFKDRKTSEIPKGLLLYGPPGTGKTHIARGLASKGGCYFLPLKLADIKGRWIGHSGRNVQRIFEEARASAPTLIFIDEIDTIFGRRGGTNQDSFANDIVNQFLAETDGVDTSGQAVFIIGATNRIELVDQAVKSRLEPVNIGLPDEDNRRKLLGKHLDQNFDRQELDKLVDKSGGLSGRDLKSLANAIKDLKNNGEQVSDGDAAEGALEGMRKIVADGLEGDSFSIKLASRSNDSPDTLSRIIGYQNLCEQLQQAVLMIQKGSEQNRKLLAAGLEPSNGILLHGPHGNGKTFVAQTLAEHHRMDYVLVSGQNLNAGFVDGTIRQLDQIIDNTIRMSVMGPVLLFFDEFDALAGKQGLSLKFRGALLNGINKLRTYPNILLMAATNFYDLLDEAVIRPGRFDTHLFMGNPESDAVAKLIKSFCGFSNFKLTITDNELSQLAEKLVQNEVSIAEIKVLCKGAQQQAVLGGTEPPFTINYDQLESARIQIRKSAS